MKMINDGVDNTTIREKTGCTIGLREISFSLSQGEILTIMGLSGSGKSTLLKMVNGLIKPTFGDITLFSKKLNTLNSKELRYLRLWSISMVFQGYALFPHRNVIQNISFGMELQNSSFNHKSYFEKNTVKNFFFLIRYKKNYLFKSWFISTRNF